MFYLRINKVKILNNREFFGKQEVQFMSFITTGTDDFPALSAFFETTDATEQRSLITEAVEQVVAARVMTTVHKVRDNHQLTFGDTGYILYKAQNIPADFSWKFMGVGIDQRTRDTGALLQTILTEDTISNLVTNIAKLATLANPVAAAATELTGLVANVVSTLFKNDKDDQIGLFIASFIRPLHYPHGIRDKQDVADITGNMYVDYSLFAYENEE